jgi:3-oxoacyl-[acyl-carrier-protein] synthase-1
MSPRAPLFPITAMALHNAVAPEIGGVLEALRAGRGGLAPLADLDGVVGLHGRCGSLEALPHSLAGFDTRQARLAAQSLAPILGDVERATRKWGASRVGVVLGTSTGGVLATERAWVRDGSPAIGFDLERHHSVGATADVVRMLAGARGPSHVVSTACSSSAKAFASARRLLAADVVDAVLVGGVDTLCELTLRGFAALELVSPGGCRPFAAGRDGLSLGEGGAFALVERRGDAAVVLGPVGESCDAHHMSAPHPAGDGAARAILAALASAELGAAEIGFVNAHATGTALNDAAEAQAIVRIFGASLPVVATKSFTGHLLGAAGATEVVLTACALAEGWVPGSAASVPVDPSLGIDVVCSTRAIECDWAISTSFAFGGSNAAVIVGLA